MLFKSESFKDTFLALILVVIGVIFRVVPHPDNFSPVTAIALFSGVTLPASIALSVPLLVMMISDLFIGTHGLIWLTWSSFFVVTCLGLLIQRNARFRSVLLGTLGASIFFFLISNLGVFLFENMYPRTWNGFVQCYVMALPFFKNTLLGDLIYGFAFFSLFYLAKLSFRRFNRI